MKSSDEGAEVCRHGIHAEGASFRLVAEPTLRDVMALIRRHLRMLVIGPLVAGLASIAITLPMDNVYTSRAVLLPPQQLGPGSSLMGQLSQLTGLVGVSSGPAAPGELFASLLRTERVLDRIVEQFDLMTVYGTTFRVQARSKLDGSARIGLGRKDGLLSIEVEDVDPERAALIATQFVEELKRVAGELALSEAQQRKLFLQAEVDGAKADLTRAQRALESSGFSEGALRSDARLAAESYARIKASVGEAEVKLRSMRRSLQDEAPEVKEAAETLVALRQQLARVEGSMQEAPPGSAYVSLFREFKYREAIYEAVARQFAIASMDAAREPPLIQVIDAPRPAELKTRPKRAVIAVVTVLISGILLFIAIYIRWRWQVLKAAAET